MTTEICNIKILQIPILFLVPIATVIAYTYMFAPFTKPPLIPRTMKAGLKKRLFREGVNLVLSTLADMEGGEGGRDGK